MKSEILSISGKKVKDINLPSLFSTKIREDIIKKAYEAEKVWQPYAPGLKSGKQHSAAGIIRHLRHAWKGGYGSGRSRVPRKIMWRRGSQFYWIGAEISSTRGGRRAHPPKVASMLGNKKINKKEGELAFRSGLAGTTKKEKIKSRYARLKDVEVKNLPIIVESKITELKTQDLISSLEKVLGNLFVVAVPERSVRAGRGKLRNRKYKKSAGVLMLIGKNEEVRTKAVEVKKVNELQIRDLYPLGRLVVYTEGAIKDLEGDKTSAPAGVPSAEGKEGKK